MFKLYLRKRRDYGQTNKVEYYISYKVCNNEPELKTNIKEVYLLLMKTPMQNKLDIITSLISLPISLMFVFPTLCLNLFLTCRPPILLLPSGL